MEYGRTVSRAQTGDLELGHARSAWHRVAASALGAIVAALLAGCDGSSLEASAGGLSPAERSPAPFHLLEARIEDIQAAIRGRSLTSTELVELYLARIKAFNGTCVEEPEGILGPITTVPDAGQLNALQTLNLRPTARAHWGFDEIGRAYV